MHTNVLSQVIYKVDRVFCPDDYFQYYFINPPDQKKVLPQPHFFKSLGALPDLFLRKIWGNLLNVFSGNRGPQIDNKHASQILFQKHVFYRQGSLKRQENSLSITLINGVLFMARE